MNRKLWFFVALTFLVSCGLIVYYSIAPTAHAAKWLATCLNVANNSTERGLWFDIAGPGSAGTNNEGGLFWLITNESANEKCSYISNISPSISTTSFPTLQVRVAVNDGARFSVRVYEQGISEFCEEEVAYILTSGTEDNSQFRVKKVDLPPGHDICAIRITLNDDPDNSPGTDSGRANALIDYVRIWNGTSSGWRESFTAGNP